MQRFTDTRDAATADELWLLEHPSVFTLGMNARREHVLAPGPIPVVQVDRGGHPTINPFVNPNNVKNTYNLGQPVDDVATYLGPWTAFLQENGGYPAEAAEQAARIVLPDILRYDRGKPVGYPNGRAMTDDTFSARFAWMSDGKIPPQGLKPHADLMSEFPYLGPPNVYPV